MPAGASSDKRPYRFFLLLFLLSIPFWLLGGTDLPLPVHLPLSALMFVCPLIAAAILTYRQAGVAGLRQLLSRPFHLPALRDRLWLLPALLLMPLIYLLSYGLMRWTGRPLPDPSLSLGAAAVYFLIYLLSAVGEELGWSGYALDPLQGRWGALRAGLLLAFVWQAWHFIPHLQQGLPLTWILWQSLHSIALRLLIVWLYNNTHRNLLAAVLLHAMDNVSWSLFPNDGSHYDPLLTGAITWLVTALVLWRWGAQTLAHPARDQFPPNP